MDAFKRACEANGGVSEVARRLGVKPPTVHQWLSGDRPVPAALAPQVEALLSQAVRRWDLRPDDWHRVWPELIGQPGAPEIPSSHGAGEVQEASAS
jgi:DNA-binding transcriptional regulator YdaS (Cro superfamily)